MRLRASLRSLPSILTIPALLLAACGGQQDPGLAAVAVDSGRFGALMVSGDGERLLPEVTRNLDGLPDAVTGALWMDGNGNSAYVRLDPATGLPAWTVFGDFVLRFSNWSADHTTADVARIYGPTGYVEVLRGVRVAEGDAAAPGKLVSAATCLPDCPSPQRTTAELLKVAGLGLSIGTCGVAVGMSWGAMLLPCSGVVVSSAKLLVGDESWLNAPLSRAAALLKGIDVLQCVAGQLDGCVSLALDNAAAEADRNAETFEKYQALVQAADDRLMNPEATAGIVSGSPPDCMESYECTPGAYLPCIPEGTRQCGPTCRWGECPPKKPSGGCQVSSDGDAVCSALIQDVTARCAATGGTIIAWSPDKASCVEGYNCWARSCPCLMSCGTRCASDLACVQDCMTTAGRDMQADAVACASCTAPEVRGQCQTGG